MLWFLLDYFSLLDQLKKKPSVHRGLFLGRDLDSCCQEPVFNMTRLFRVLTEKGAKVASRPTTKGKASDGVCTSIYFVRNSLGLLLTVDTTL